MGAEVNSKTYSREQRTRYRQRLLENLDRFAGFLSTAKFADTASIGLELELNLTNQDFTRSAEHSSSGGDRGSCFPDRDRCVQH